MLDCWGNRLGGSQEGAALPGAFGVNQWNMQVLTYVVAHVLQLSCSRLDDIDVLQQRQAPACNTGLQSNFCSSGRVCRTVFRQKLPSSISSMVRRVRFTRKDPLNPYLVDLGTDTGSTITMMRLCLQACATTRSSRSRMLVSRSSNLHAGLSATCLRIQDAGSASSTMPACKTMFQESVCR